MKPTLDIFDRVLIRLLGVMLSLASIYDAMYLTHGSDAMTFVLGTAGMFCLFWPSVWMMFEREMNK